MTWISEEWDPSQNFGDDDQTEWKPPSSGWHVFRVTQLELTTSKTKGDPMVVFRLTVTGKSNAEEGRHFLERAVLTEKAIWRLGKIANAIWGPPGHPPAFRDPENGLDPMSQKSLHKCLLGRLFLGKVRTYKDTYNGEPSWQVDLKQERYLNEEQQEKVLMGYGGELPPLPDDAHKTGKPNGSSSNGADQGETFSDDGKEGWDDIPF